MIINVTKSFLPPIEDYQKYLQGIWERGHLTNHGPLVLELEEKLRSYIQAKHLWYVSNGTIALQLAIKALELQGEIITTPFSYVATCSSIAWEGSRPVFVDIHEDTLTIDEGKIEEAITPRTTAILATHVYGIPCNVLEIERIAQRHNLKIIYDAAHAFGVKYNGIDLVNYGDLSTLSFHATKLFHTIEGGAVVTSQESLAHKISYLRNFGHKGQEEFWGLGINGKSSEFHAAMGLCIYPHIAEIIASRRNSSVTYDRFFSELGVNLKRPIIPALTEYNYSYYPVIFETERQLLQVRDSLNAAFIYPRRYFYPSLNTLPYCTPHQAMPFAEAISSRVMCLPLYYDIKEESIRRICQIIAEVLKY